MKKYKRTEVYKQKQEPKYMFQWICDHIYSSVPEPRNMLDIGAASGDFLDYASARFLNCEFIGIERDPELVEIGNQNSRFQLTNGDAENLQFDDQFFDVVIMTGTHSIFDDFQPSFTEALRVTKTGGLIMITGIFNDYPIDTQIAGDTQTQIRLTGILDTIIGQKRPFQISCMQMALLTCTNLCPLNCPLI